MAFPETPGGPGSSFPQLKQAEVINQKLRFFLKGPPRPGFA